MEGLRAVGARRPRAEVRVVQLALLGVVDRSSLTLSVPPDLWTSCQMGQRRQDRINVWGWRDSTRTVYWLCEQAEDLAVTYL